MSLEALNEQNLIIYKKTDERYRTKSGTARDNELQRVTTSGNFG